MFLMLSINNAQVSAQRIALASTSINIECSIVLSVWNCCFFFGDLLNTHTARGYPRAVADMTQVFNNVQHMMS